ncbi:hypothetical protein DAPPUDRAFT_303743 [Daphnia pulex]|uniref:Uncharacterized protein n=1 Tax=Daphnia pulex TaxID=6669 RepID=E9GHS2_DAPPU|nr:hypothetical protein DAPPUDRAFT_303743 [Daphnia pulex]|eukprot:EFX81000.1 hypothetical protein DAPPUDRAFT_303743 [Daphnia pulex]
MLNKSTAIFLVVLIGSLMTAVAGHRRNLERKLAGIHHHLLGSRGERCPPGMKLVFSTSSPSLLAGNFAARCERSDIASPFTSSNTLIQSNTAFDAPKFQQPTDIFRPFPFLPGAAFGHQLMGLNRAAFPNGFLQKERALHKTLGSKLNRHSMKHILHKSKF